ncbi:MAG: hypothetical protein ABIK81_03225 [candidate division WOR-3 bacterium]
MKKLIINDFAFLGVIDNKGSLSDWVLIPALITENLVIRERRYYRVIST